MNILNIRYSVLLLSSYKDITQIDMLTNVYKNYTLTIDNLEILI